MTFLRLVEEQRDPVAGNFGTVRGFTTGATTFDAKVRNIHSVSCNRTYPLRRRRSFQPAASHGRPIAYGDSRGRVHVWAHAEGTRSYPDYLLVDSSQGHHQPQHSPRRSRPHVMLIPLPKDTSPDPYRQRRDHHRFRRALPDLRYHDQSRQSVISAPAYGAATTAGDEIRQRAGCGVCRLRADTNQLIAKAGFTFQLRLAPLQLRNTSAAPIAADGTRLARQGNEGGREKSLDHT